MRCATLVKKSRAPMWARSLTLLPPLGRLVRNKALTRRPRSTTSATEIVAWESAPVTPNPNNELNAMRNFELPGRSRRWGNAAWRRRLIPLSTLAAVDALRGGGNAVDAAVTACAVQCVVEAGSTGIGGDCFALVSRGGSTDVIGYNGSGRTPAAATAEWYEQHGFASIERSSPHAVTIPGAVEAWSRLIEDHGRRPLKAALEPAIALAREGYVPLAARRLRHRKATRSSLARCDSETASSSMTGKRRGSGRSGVSRSSPKRWKRSAARARTPSIAAPSPRRWSATSEAAAGCIRWTISRVPGANTSRRSRRNIADARSMNVRRTGRGSSR